MKTQLSILIAGSIFLMSCSSMNQTSYRGGDDDLYFSKSDARANAIYHPEVEISNQSGANRNMYDEDPQQQNKSGINYQSTPQNSNGENIRSDYQNPQYSDGANYDDDRTVINNNYYGDVYDEGDSYYARRIQRFHRPYGNFGYYSPAYCGFYGDPYWNSGWNIGFGYSSLWGPSWSIGYGWGGGFYDPFWGPYYSPYSWYGGWGYNSWSYRNGYWNGYWDGRYDQYGWGNGSNGWYNGNRNTVMNKPRPSRGGSVGSGNRATPTREVGENTGGSSTGAMRPSNINRNPIDNQNQTLTSPSRENPNINRSNNGYVPPRVPSRTPTSTERYDNNNGNDRPSNVISRPSQNQNLNVNPNYGGSRNTETRPASTPRVRENRNYSDPRPVSSPNYSRPNAPSYSAPSRGSSGGGGGVSSPSSRPSRPR